MVWETSQTPTAAQVSTHKNQSCGSVCEQHVSEIHYQFWGTHVVLKDLRERERKKRFGREKPKLLSPHLCGNQTQSLAGFGFIKAKLIIHC